MSNCEWMFGDAATGVIGLHALAHLNPLRWSGPVSFTKASADLEDVLAQGGRPIIVKVPANTGNVKNFDTTQEAITYLKAEDPLMKVTLEARRKAEASKAAAVAKEKAERVAAAQESADAAHAVVKAKEADAVIMGEEETKAKSESEQAEKTATEKAQEVVNAKKDSEAQLVKAREVKSGEKAEWMFADLGAGAIAHLNPLRWSGGKPVDEIIGQLEELVANETKRPIIVRKPPGLTGQEWRFDSPQPAVDLLFELCPAKKPLWAASIEALKIVKSAEKAATAAKDAIPAARENASKAAERKAVAEGELVSLQKAAEEADALVLAASEAD